MRSLEVRYEGVRREPEATVVDLTVWDGTEKVFSLGVIVDSPDEAMLRSAAVWAAREIEAHGVDRYGELTSEDGSMGELRADLLAAGPSLAS